MKKENTYIVIDGCVINFHFSHIKEPNQIPEQVEQMLLTAGLPQDMILETTEKSA